MLSSPREDEQEGDVCAGLATVTTHESRLTPSLGLCIYTWVSIVRFWTGPIPDSPRNGLPIGPIGAPSTPESTSGNNFNEKPKINKGKNERENPISSPARAPLGVNRGTLNGPRPSPRLAANLACLELFELAHTTRPVILLSCSVF